VIRLKKGMPIWARLTNPEIAGVVAEEEEER
jgi:hypothetical protein